jgi:hypothetical protein
MPLEVAQTGSSATDAAGRRPSKFEEQGKKFGRKMGNAGEFGCFLICKSLLTAYSNLRCWCHDWFQHCQWHLLDQINIALGICLCFKITLTRPMGTHNKIQGYGLRIMGLALMAYKELSRLFPDRLLL